MIKCCTTTSTHSRHSDSKCPFHYFNEMWLHFYTRNCVSWEFKHVKWNKTLKENLHSLYPKICEDINIAKVNTWGREGKRGWLVHFLLNLLWFLPTSVADFVFISSWVQVKTGSRFIVNQISFQKDFCLEWYTQDQCQVLRAPLCSTILLSKYRHHDLPRGSVEKSLDLNTGRLASQVQANFSLICVCS